MSSDGVAEILARDHNQCLAPHEHNPATVWLVISEIPYETPYPVAIFESERAAQVFAHTCEDYEVVECAVNRSATFVDGVFGFYNS